MAVADIPSNLIVNERSSYSQFLWFMPQSGRYRWDANVDYCYAVGFVPVEGQGLDPRPPIPPLPTPFTVPESEYLDATFVKTINGEGPDSEGNVEINGGGAVDSVNGQTGPVTLDASDVGAAESQHSHTLADITDTTPLGRQLASAQDATSVRSAIGAGTGSGTVKTVNSVAPDASGNVNVSTSAGSAAGLSKRASAFAADKVAAAGASRANYDDAAVFSDNFANLSNWALTAGKLQVSGNALYGAGGGTAAGMNHAFSIRGGGAKAVFKAVVNIVGAPASGGDIIIGFSSDSAGAVPASTAQNVRGINFQPDGTIRIWNLGRDTTSPSLGTYAAGTYYVTVTVYAAFISISVTNTDGTFAANRVIDRTGWLVNNIFIFMNDPRGTSGSNITNVGVTGSIGSHSNRALVEDMAPFWSHIAQTSGGSYMVRIAFPKAYDSRRPQPLIFMFHGHGGTPDRYGNSADGYYPAAKAYVDAGFIVVSAGYLPNTMTWGSDDSLLAYEWAYNYVCSFVAFSNVIFHANSMGGIESLLTIARGVIPCEGWIATVPTTNLKDNYDTNFGPSITTAYGIAANGSDYATKTAGHDPMLLDPSFMYGLAVYVMIATDDTTVYPARNWDLFEPKIKDHLRSYKRVNVTGGHTSSSLNNSSATLAAFAKTLVSNQPLP